MILHKQNLKHTGKLLLIFLCLLQSVRSSNSTIDIFNEIEKKMEFYSSLIRFDPQSIKTNCTAVEEKYHQYT